MKKVIALTAALAVIAAAAPADAGLGMKIRGGYAWIGYGDFNDWVDGMNSEIPSGTPELDNINWVPEVSVELTIPLIPTFSGGVGIGYISGKSDYSVDFGSDEFSFTHEFKAVPILVNFYWEPSMGSISPFVYAGVGFYRTTVDFEYWLTSGGDRSGYTAELDKWDFGVQGGGGVTIALAPKVGLDIGLQGRLADISGFDGTATSSDGETKDVYLARYDDYFGPEERMPNENLKPEGSVDLSGYTLFIGLTFGF